MFSGNVTITNPKSIYSLGEYDFLPQDIVKISGAIDGSIISISDDDGVIWIMIDNHEIYKETVNRMLFIDSNGEKQLLMLNNVNQNIRPELQNQGIATLSLREQIYVAQRIGVSSIIVHATGSYHGAYNGYYTWARLGFNALLPESILNKLPTNLKHSRDILDLMATEQGRDWWLKNGSSLNMSFDLQENSRSIRMFQSYLNDKYGELNYEINE